jgi:phosphoribosylaminoimidazole carboxylase (NCAIR synthetase)
VCQRTLNKNFHEKGSSVLSQNKAPNGVQEEEEEESQEEEARRIFYSWHHVGFFSVEFGLLSCLLL